MPRIILAGYNLDAEVVSDLVSRHPSPPILTPETLSAAYARISRDPRQVDELRAAARADVARARASNERIVFGLGHASVAEHAVLNFDVLDCSRLAVETLESHRLASYTEKSQRYVRLRKDYVVPPEVRDSGGEGRFRSYMARAFDRYRALCEGLERAGADPRIAGEDARYALPLAVSAQLGMTANLRTVERMVLHLAASPLREVRDLGAMLREAASAIAPSLVRHCDPGPYDLCRDADVMKTSRDLLCGTGVTAANPGPVTLVHATPGGDELILAALTAPAMGGGLAGALRAVDSLDERSKLAIYEAATRHIAIHDPAPREFEHASLTFDVTVSAAAFGQLKRHRMATITTAPYDTRLGITVPPAMEGAGMTPVLVEAGADAEECATSLGSGPLSWYALLNAHRRRVCLTVNLRELCHISRLREDVHAQWDIRAIAGEMSRLAREAFPVCARVLGGKSSLDRARIID